MVSETIKNGAVAGVVGAISVVLFTALGYAVIGQPEKLLQTGCLIYIGWVSSGIFLASLVGAVLYDSIPGETAQEKGLIAGVVLGIPIYTSGQLLPSTRPIDAAYGPIPVELAIPANFTFFILGGIISMGIVLYKFNDLQSGSSQESGTGVPA